MTRLFVLTIAYLVAVSACIVAVPPPPTAIAQAQLASISGAIELYQIDRGQLPTTLTQLVPKHLTSLPVDPWGNPYRFAPGNGGFVVSSLGADAKQGGTGPNADILVSTRLRGL